MAQPRTQLLLRLLFLLALASCVAAAAATEAEAPAPARGAATTRTATGCRRGDLVVRQRATGRVVEGKPEYAVEVRNACRCAQSRVLLRCYGLSSVEAVDPRAIRAVDGERCLLRGGRALPRLAGEAVWRYLKNPGQSRR